MEDLVNLSECFSGIYKNKKVLITGHTGFKGSWLAYWLQLLGANTAGLSLLPPTNPNHFELLSLQINSIIGDIRDRKFVQKTILEYQPEIVFHLAAQPLVRQSYYEPIETFETNVIGTANILEACRHCKSIRAIVVISSDKCYENKEWPWGYRENDPMGGHDPYSASKGCTELVAASFRKSFFNINDYNKKHQILLATARAGNVIGGGDWATDRLIPDIIKCFANNSKAIIRNPSAIRPWQHVLEPLSGYLLLGQKLLEGKTEFAEAWNFGPLANDTLTVKEIVTRILEIWPEIKVDFSTTSDNLHEAHLLKLDCSKANQYLKWFPIWDIEKTILHTITWYKEFYENKIILTKNNLLSYLNDAQKKNCTWIKKQ